MITLHLLRHGETVWHTENRYAGITDVALNATGQAQARNLGGWARAAQLHLIATSDLSRAVRTGHAAALAADVPHLIDPGFREVDFGDAEGLTRREMEQRFPEALAAFTASPASSPLPGGELGAHAAERGLSAICRMLQPLPDDATVAVVAHTTLIRLMLCRMMGIPLDDYRRRFPTLENVAVTTVTVAQPAKPTDLDQAAALVRFNAPTC